MSSQDYMIFYPVSYTCDQRPGAFSKTPLFMSIKLKSSWGMETELCWNIFDSSNIEASITKYDCTIFLLIQSDQSCHAYFLFFEVSLHKFFRKRIVIVDLICSFLFFQNNAFDYFSNDFLCYIVLSIPYIFPSF